MRYIPNYYPMTLKEFIANKEAQGKTMTADEISDTDDLLHKAEESAQKYRQAIIDAIKKAHAEHIAPYKDANIFYSSTWGTGTTL